MVGQFLAAIPGEGFVKLTRQPSGLFDQRRDDAFGVFVGNLDQHHIPGMALDQRGDVAVLRPADQVALPVPRDGTVFDAGGPLSDRHRILDLTQSVALEAGMPGAADRASGAQMLEQLLLQNAPGLDIQAPIDRLM